MILVDTSVWIDHLRTANANLARLLGDGAVLSHPWVTGELALDNLGNRAEVIALLRNLPRATVAADEEVLGLIDRATLAGTGIGFVDAALLAATRLTPDAKLWTRDKRLSAVAVRLGVGFAPPSER